jgi:hypothetical protein
MIRIRVVTPYPRQLIPANLDDLEKLSHPLWPKAIYACGILAIQEIPSPSSRASPKNSCAPIPLIEYVPAKCKPLEKNKEGTDTSTSMKKEDPKKKKDSKVNHAVPLENYYASNHSIKNRTGSVV